MVVYIQLKCINKRALEEEVEIYLEPSKREKDNGSL